MKRKPKIEVRTDRRISDGSSYHWWRLVGANGQIMCHSETFPTRSNAVRAAKRAKVLMTEAEIVK